MLGGGGIIHNESVVKNAHLVCLALSPPQWVGRQSLASPQEDLHLGGWRKGMELGFTVMDTCSFFGKQINGRSKC